MVTYGDTNRHRLYNFSLETCHKVSLQVTQVVTQYASVLCTDTINLWTERGGEGECSINATHFFFATPLWIHHNIKCDPFHSSSNCTAWHRSQLQQNYARRHSGYSLLEHLRPGQRPTKRRSGLLWRSAAHTVVCWGRCRNGALQRHASAC